MTDLPFDLPPAEPVKATPKEADPGDLELAGWAADLILTAELARPRSKQRSIGPSGIGDACDRKIAYQLAGTDPVALSDPLKAYVGTGYHALAAQALRTLDPEQRRYLVEHKVTYRGVSGELDLYDRRRRTVIDWKTKELSKVRRTRKDGIGHGYRVQLHVYGAGVEAAGEVVEQVAIAYVPVNGNLSDIYVWSEPYDRAIADEAIDRMEGLKGVAPADATPTPSRLCPWCPFYRAGWAGSLAVACPGNST